MDSGLLIQYVLVALAVLVSLWVVIKKQFPGTLRRARGVIALRLLRDGASGWRQALGRRIAPPASSAGACGGCDSCGPSTPKQH